MRTLALIRSGIATTIQDTGRSGYQQIGIPPSGAMDKFAMLMGQRHLGHRNNEAALEFAYGDLAFKTSHPCRFVVTGAPALITIGDATHHSGSLEHTEANQLVNIHTSGHGVYNYLHVAGGIAISTCLGSRSTSPRERIGGLEGRYLRDGDILPLGPESKDYEALDSIMPSTRHRDTLSLRFIPGFQFDQFSETTRQKLISQVFSVTPRANRMGIALSGDPVDTGIQARYSLKPPVTVPYKYHQMAIQLFYSMIAKRSAATPKQGPLSAVTAIAWFNLAPVNVCDLSPLRPKRRIELLGSSITTLRPRYHDAPYGQGNH